MQEKRILICEDEDAIRDFIVINLKRSGYEVTDVNSGELAIKEFENAKGDFHVALLDVMMPGIDGFEVCKQIRSKNNQIGIIMLSAKSQEMDKVRGLMLGADDYITKPFSPSELVARVDAICRRVFVQGEDNEKVDIITSLCFELNLKSRTLTKNGELIDLTQVEYQIIEYFLKNKNAALSRDSILEQIWGENYFGDVKIVDVNIRRLRIKIEEEPSKPLYIQTIWGFGYKWQE